jgi:hypothetical protein
MYLILRYLQFFISLIYPLAVVVILFLAWQDWHRYVNVYLQKLNKEKALEEEVQEFIE